MKARIAQLEAELKARSGADDAAAAERDANALRSAEGVGTAAQRQRFKRRQLRLLRRHPRLPRFPLKSPPRASRFPATGLG